MPALYHVYVAGPAGLVRRVIGDVNLPPVVLVGVPPLGEGDDVVGGDCILEKRADGRVAVDPHAGGEERMVVCVIGIMLGCIPLADEEVGGKVQDEAPVTLAEPAGQPLADAVCAYQLPDHHIRPGPKAAAPGAGELGGGGRLALASREERQRNTTDGESVGFAWQIPSSLQYPVSDSCWNYGSWNWYR